MEAFSKENNLNVITIKRLMCAEFTVVKEKYLGLTNKIKGFWKIETTNEEKSGWRSGFVMRAVRIGEFLSPN